MKMFTTKMLGLVISALLLGACSQMATYENEDLNKGLEKADQSGFNLSPYGVSNGENNAVYSDEACLTECFKPDDPTTYFYLNGRENFNPQIYTDYNVYQTATHIFYEFSIAASNSSTPLISTYELDGTSMTVGASSFSVSYPLPANWQVCDLVSRTFTITRNGNANQNSANVVIVPIDYKLIKICVDEPETCEEEFTWSRDVNDANTITFEYTPHRSKINAEIQMTTPQITAYQPLDGKVYTQFGNPSNGNGGLRWNGDLVCGEKITFTIKFTPISCNNSNNLPANLVSNFVVKDMGGNKLTGQPITGDCIGS
ncbi:hypothetical protein [Algoriphagus sp.]|uniref:hypothetical protein n=1 Tax=Algoriphagus sp. TaxID=1872435 RepID=UPI0025CB845E|nr:hypothetical protein [Algoriphagus sp.]